MRKKLVVFFILAASASLLTSCGVFKLTPREKHESSTVNDSLIVSLIRQELSSADLLMTQEVTEYFPPINPTPSRWEVADSAGFPLNVQPPKIRNPTPSGVPERGAVRKTVKSEIRLQANKSVSTDSTSISGSVSKTEEEEKINTDDIQKKSKTLNTLRMIRSILFLIMLLYIVIKLSIALHKS